jgi:hypothetical protein
MFYNSFVVYNNFFLLSQIRIVKLNYISPILK